MKRIDAQALVSTPLRRHFATQAAARETFKPTALIEDWLKNHQGASADEQVEVVQVAIELRDASMPCIDASGGEAFRLPAPQRQGVLRAVGREAVLDLLAQTSDTEGSLTERLFHDLLVGRPVPDASDRTQLVAMREAVEWTSALDAAPTVDAQALTRHLQQFDFLQALGGHDLHRFVGREQFRKTLMKIWRQDVSPLQTVLVEGPGGVGKSLGIARFIADVLEEPDPMDVPHAVFHLDFDRASLRRATDASLLQELVRQSVAWVGPGAADTLKSQGRDFGSYDTESVSTGSRGYRPDKLSLAETLAEALAPGNRARVLLFADSFEQVEGEDDNAAQSVHKVARLLEPYCSRLMLIYASRAFVRPGVLSYSAKLKLKGLPASEADTYLRNEADRLGVDVAQSQIRKIRQLVGCTPLALRLAVRVLEQAEGPVDAADLEAMVAGSSEMTQALLYDRVLRRLKDETLRRIALPSLQLRHLTAEIIDEVLADLCGVDRTTTPGEVLLQKCQKEPTLFTAVGGTAGGIVRHRPDVRSNMLAQVDRSMDTSQWRRINEAAIRYFAARPGLEDRAEEAYHRLRLDEPEEANALQWQPELAELLRPNASELPARARAFLRKRLGSSTAAGAVAELSRLEEVPPEGPAAGDATREFEIYARKLLQSGDGADFIINELEGRQQALVLQLGDLYAGALMQCKRHTRLLEFAREFASRVPEKHNRRVGSSVLSIAAALLEGRSELGPAQQYWILSLRWAETLDAMARLPCLVGSIRLRRKVRIGKARREQELRSGLALLEEVDLGPQQETMAREVAAEFGEALVPTSVRSSETSSSLYRIVSMVLESNQAFPSVIEDRDRVRQIGERLIGMPMTSTHELSSVVMRLFYGADERAIRRIVGVLREEVDWTLRVAARPYGVPMPNEPAHVRARGPVGP